MSRLNPNKLHMKCVPDTRLKELILPRRYTLTHSDMTGDLYLTIGKDYDMKQISGLYTRFMRDEVLAEWKSDEKGLSLHVYCHISGGLVFGRANWRESIFRSEMPLVLEAIRYGDRALFAAVPKLDKAPILVHLCRRSGERIEQWGMPSDYKVWELSLE